MGRGTREGYQCQGLGKTREEATGAEEKPRKGHQRKEKDLKRRRAGKGKAR